MRWWFIFLLATSSFAADFDENTRWDLSTKLGFTLGRVTKEGSTTLAEATYDFSGIPLAIALNHDLSKFVSLSEEIQLMMDFLNRSISRIGLSESVLINLFGGARRLVSNYGNIVVIRKTGFNVSLLIKGGLHIYGASTKTSNVRLDGIVFESAAGFSSRFDLSATSSLGVELSRTLLSLAASSTRLKGSFYEASLFFRYYL